MIVRPVLSSWFLLVSPWIPPPTFQRCWSELGLGVGWQQHPSWVWDSPHGVCSPHLLDRESRLLSEGRFLEMNKTKHENNIWRIIMLLQPLQMFSDSLQSPFVTFHHRWCTSGSCWRKWIAPTDSTQTTWTLERVAGGNVSTFGQTQH